MEGGKTVCSFLWCSTVGVLGNVRRVANSLKGKQSGRKGDIVRQKDTGYVGSSALKTTFRNLIN